MRANLFVYLMPEHVGWKHIFWKFSDGSQWTTHARTHSLYALHAAHLHSKSDLRNKSLCSPYTSYTDHQKEIDRDTTHHPLHAVEYSCRTLLACRKNVWFFWKLRTWNPSCSFGVFRRSYNPQQLQREHCVFDQDTDSNPQVTIAAFMSVCTWSAHASLWSHTPRNWNQMGFQGFSERRLSAAWDCPWIQLFMRLQWIVWLKIPWFGQSRIPTSPDDVTRCGQTQNVNGSFSRWRRTHLFVYMLYWLCFCALCAWDKQIIKNNYAGVCSRCRWPLGAMCFCRSP